MKLKISLIQQVSAKYQGSLTSYSIGLFYLAQDNITNLDFIINLRVYFLP